MADDRTHQANIRLHEEDFHINTLQQEYLMIFLAAGVVTQGLSSYLRQPLQMPVSFLDEFR